MHPIFASDSPNSIFGPILILNKTQLERSLLTASLLNGNFATRCTSNKLPVELNATICKSLLQPTKHHTVNIPKQDFVTVRARSWIIKNSQRYLVVQKVSVELVGGIMQNWPAGSFGLLNRLNIASFADFLAKPTFSSIWTLESCPGAIYLVPVPESSRDPLFPSIFSQVKPEHYVASILQGNCWVCENARSLPPHNCTFDSPSLDPHYREVEDLGLRSCPLCMGISFAEADRRLLFELTSVHRQINDVLYVHSPNSDLQVKLVDRTAERMAKWTHRMRGLGYLPRSTLAEAFLYD